MRVCVGKAWPAGSVGALAPGMAQSSECLQSPVACSWLKYVHTLSCPANLPQVKTFKMSRKAPFSELQKRVHEEMGVRGRRGRGGGGNSRGCGCAMPYGAVQLVVGAVFPPAIVAYPTILALGTQLPAPPAGAA